MPVVVNFLAIAQHVVKLDGFEAVIVFCIKQGNGTTTKAEHQCLTR